MEQLLLDLAAAQAPSFDNYVPGPNGEVVAALQRLVRGGIADTGLLLWGGDGVGKSHLLEASVTEATALGVPAILVPVAGLGDVPVGAWDAFQIVAIDDVQAATAPEQGALFTLYNARRAAGSQLLLASRVPPAGLPFREDVRTRLGWGLVYELEPLPDDDKPAALAEYARRRGFALSDDVIGYLLAHSRRDMRALCATLADLDRRSLAVRRPITIPLLREWLQRDMRLAE